MTLQYTFSCDGAWDDGKMPCRGSLPAGTTYESTALATAREAGWSLDWNADYCPAHTRKRDAE